jgi:hypothetical protein
MCLHSIESVPVDGLGYTIRTISPLKYLDIFYNPEKKTFGGAMHKTHSNQDIRGFEFDGALITTKKQLIHRHIRAEIARPNDSLLVAILLSKQTQDFHEERKRRPKTFPLPKRMGKKNSERFKRILARAQEACKKGRGPYAVRFKPGTRIDPAMMLEIAQKVSEDYDFRLSELFNLSPRDYTFMRLACQSADTTLPPQSLGFQPLTFF